MDTEPHFREQPDRQPHRQQRPLVPQRQAGGRAEDQVQLQAARARRVRRGFEPSDLRKQL